MNRFPANGAIDPTAFPRLLADLHRHGATGTLSVEGPTYRKALHFRNGRILFGSSDDPRDQIGAILIEAGKVSVQTVEAEAAKVGPGKPLATVLSEGGLVGEDDLADAGRLKVERILADLLNRSTGRFEFEDGVLPKGAIDLQLSTPRAFMTAACAAGPELAVAVLGAGERTLRRSDQGDALLAELEPDARALAKALDSDSSLLAVSLRAGLTSGESEGLAAGLVLLGLAEPSAVPAPAPEAKTFTPTADEATGPIVPPSLADLEIRRRALFPAEPLVIDHGVAEPPVVKTAAGAHTVDLRDQRREVQRPAGAEPEEAARNAQVTLGETAALRRRPPTREHTAPFRRPASPPTPAARRTRSAVPALLAAAVLVGAAASGLWLWLNTSGREPAGSALDIPATGSPPLAGAVAESAPPRDSETVTPEASPAPPSIPEDMAPTPPPGRPPQAGGTADSALALLRKGELAEAARGFANTLPRDGYAIQLLVACSPQTAIKAAAQVTSPDLYVLPVRLQGRDCYRVLYGRYPSQATAAAALRRSVPAYFTRDASRPRIVALAEVAR